VIGRCARPPPHARTHRVALYKGKFLQLHDAVLHTFEREQALVEKLREVRRVAVAVTRM
jgi:hypothetical protein